MRCMLHSAFCILRPAVCTSALLQSSFCHAMPCHAVLCRARPCTHLHAHTKPLTTSHFVSKMAPFRSFPTLTESSCNHYSQSRRLNLVVPDCFVRSEVHPTIPSTRCSHTHLQITRVRLASSPTGPAKRTSHFFFLLTTTPTPTPAAQGCQGSRAPSSVARFLTHMCLPACPPGHPLPCAPLYCYRSVGSSGTQSTIASQTVKAAISLSPGDGTLVLKTGHVRTTTCSLTSFSS